MTDVLQISEAARRWLEIIDDPALAERSERIETEPGGQMIMAPPPDFLHRTQAKKIQAYLDRLFGEERAVTEQPIETANGAIKIADVVWLTQEQYQRLLAEPKLPLKPAPPICVEIISPSNTAAAPDEKRALYFATGASEVWLCERKGRLRFFDASGEIEKSRLVPAFPRQISLEKPKRLARRRTRDPERDPGRTAERSRVDRDPPER
jgi:Uma2 family endonuclease